AKRLSVSMPLMFFFSPHPAATAIYSLSLHDALPISRQFAAGKLHVLVHRQVLGDLRQVVPGPGSHWETIRLGPPLRDVPRGAKQDRKSTRLNSSHDQISYAVFCLKKKNNKTALAYTS